MTPVLEMSNLEVTAGSLRILNGVSLELESGRILAIVGPNGAGKTTLLDAISGLTPTNRAVSLDGSTDGVSKGKPRKGVGRVFQGSPLPETLTIGEVARLVSPDRNVANELLRTFGLIQYESLFVSELSTGMRRILDLALATAGRPKILLLDEPASGLAQSEIEHLASVIKRWRDESGAAVIIVEHDAWLVREVADEVAVMSSGQVIARGSPGEVLDAVRSELKPRVRNPADPAFKASLKKVGEGVVKQAPVSRSISTWTLARLGLREMAAGMGSVLLLGVLNRVLKVELGISLGVVAAILASFNLAAPFALVIGHRSDRFRIFGKRRTPYIIGGSVIAGVAVAAAPHVAGRLADGVTFGAVSVTVALFIAMGIGMYGAGTVFLALLADIVPARERAHAVSVVYIMLMLGVMVGVALTISVVEDDASNLGELFGLAGLLIIVFSALAVWGKEPIGDSSETSEEEYIPLKTAVGRVWKMSQARLFFVLSSLAVVFLLLQQAVLEPYGGDVLGLSIRATSTFNAVMFVGVLLGMWLTGRPFAARYGHIKLARVGIYGGVIAFGALAFAAVSKSSPPSWLAIFFIGIATGIFTIALLALMMGMVDKRRTALFMGLWTMGRAVADVAAVAGGGLVFEIARRITLSEPGGYASVFAIESVGLLICLPLLARLSPGKFREQAGSIDEAELDPAG